MAAARNISIAGAGLVGSLLGAMLAQKGHHVTIYERRPDMRRHDIGGGRSINLALSDRGWKALKMIGVDDQVREMAIPMYGRMIHNEDGSQAFQPYGKENQAIYSVSRGGLNMLLMDHAEAAGVKLIFDNGCEEVNTEATEMKLNSGENIHSDLIFGADGAFSKVRLSMMMTDRYNYHQFYLAHAYKELSIPAGAGDKKWQVEKNALHIWPRHSFMLIALPNIDGSFTCTLFAPFEGRNSFDEIKNNKALQEYFECHFPDAVPLMTTLEEDFFSNPTSSLVTVKAYPWRINNTALIGDAAHAIVPFYGQGMNAGFEDCSVLREITDAEDEWENILEKYQASRKPNGDAIADLAVKNFIEMRDLIADPEFLLRKKVEKMLHEKLKDKYMPVYSMVTFSHIPYKEALEQLEIQNKFFNNLFSNGYIHENIQPEELNKLADLWLKEYKLT